VQVDSTAGPSGRSPPTRARSPDGRCSSRTGRLGWTT
jgi:hypothetical protein